VRGDAERLQQVIWNLLANAIKFTPDGGAVDVFIEPAGDHVQVRVVDTGQGISQDFLPHVFERFRQADGSTTRRHTGLGLGLAIARQLVELHGGTLQADSPGQGRGATFTMRLPVVGSGAAAGYKDGLEDRRTAAATASPEARSIRIDDLRVLLVDDTDDGRALTALVLTQAGACVQPVSSAREALESIERDPPDVLVSDIGLPGADGYALILQIRQHEAAHGGFLPAVALTGYARVADRDRILAAGFQSHVTKPLDPIALTAAIGAIAHRR
jgi:CheY-like chemotaxis protein